MRAGPLVRVAATAWSAWLSSRGPASRHSVEALGLEAAKETVGLAPTAQRRSGWRPRRRRSGSLRRWRRSGRRPQRTCWGFHANFSREDVDCAKVPITMFIMMFNMITIMLYALMNIIIRSIF